MKTELGEKSWIVTVPAAAVALAYLFVFFLPNQRAIHELSEQLAAKQDYIASAGELAAALQATQGRLNRTRAYNKTCSASTPSEGDLAAVFGRINALATASGSRPTRFDREPAVAMDKLCRVPVVLGCTGSFAQIATFLYELESGAEMIWVDRLELESLGQDGEGVGCELDLTIFADNPGDSDQVDLAG